MPDDPTAKAADFGNSQQWRAVLDAAAPLPDEATRLALSSALGQLRDIANAHSFARQELPPSQQASLLRRVADSRAKDRARLTEPGEPPGGLVREEISRLLVAAIEKIRGEDIDADQEYRDLLARWVWEDQVLRQAAELATQQPWSIRERPSWPLGLMKGLVYIWTAILGRSAGASVKGPFVRFAAACLELLDFPEHMRTGAAIRAEYRRPDMAK